MGIISSIENFGNKVALISPDKGTFTYSDLIEQSFILKNYIKANSFILLVCTNSIETFIGYIFAMKNNCRAKLFPIALPNSFGPTGEYQYLLDYHGLTGDKIFMAIKEIL